MIASQSHTPLPLSEVSKECEAVLPISTQSAPPSARVSDGDSLSWVSEEAVDDMPGRAVSVAKDVVFLGDVRCAF